MHFEWTNDRVSNDWTNIFHLTYKIFRFLNNKLKSNAVVFSIPIFFTKCNINNGKFVIKFKQRFVGTTEK